MERRRAILILLLLLFSTDTSSVFAERISITDGNRSEFGNLYIRSPFNTICHGARLGTTRSASRDSGAVVRVVANPVKTIRRLNNRIREVEGKRRRRLIAKKKVFVAAKTQCNPVRGSELIGVNLAAHAPWSSDFLFVDAFKKAHPWQSANFPFDGNFDTEIEIPLDLNGYPTADIPYTPGMGIKPQALCSFFFTNLERGFPEGDYTLIFEGTGSVAVFNEAGDVSFDNGGSYSVPIESHSEGVTICITGSDASNPIQNIQFILPGFEGVSDEFPFHPEYLDAARPFSVLRLMQISGSNGEDHPCDNDVDQIDITCVKDWSNRKTSGYYSQVLDKGVAPEYLIDFANELQAKLWVNIPHAATDTYIREFARLVRDRFDESLGVYVEYSNEIFNPDIEIYQQHEWAANMGLNLGYSGDRDIARLRFTAKRTADTFRIFEQEFGAGADRLTFVLPNFLGIPTEGDTLRSAFTDVTYNPDGIMPDAIAYGAYFGASLGPEYSATGQESSITVSQILSQIRTDFRTDRQDMTAPSEIQQSYLTLIQQGKAVADRWGLPMIAYEGGQHLVANGGFDANEDMVQSFRDVNRSRQMRALYQSMFDIWFENSGGLFLGYNLIQQPTNFGNFGAMEYQAQPKRGAHKYKALLDAMRRQGR